MKNLLTKRILQSILICGACIVLVTEATTITNPILWADIPDPSVVFVNDKYYMSFTTMHMAPGAPIMESKDMVNWKIVGYAYKTLDNSNACNLNNGNMYGRGSWASSIRYKDGTFYVLVPSLTTGKTHLYSTKDVKNGPWKEVQLPFFHDPSLVLDNDGHNYVVYGGGDIKIIELNADLSGVKNGGLNKTLLPNAASVAGPSIMLSAEGSHVEKHNGYYYVFNICWPNGSGRTQLCYRGKSLSGSFEGKVVLNSNGVAQGSIIQMKDSSWIGYLFQDNGSVGRSPWLMPVTWQNDWPVFNDGKAPTSFEMPTVYSSEGTGVVTSDDFSGSNMKLEWQWNHNPDNANWSLSARPGYYRITTSRVDNDIKKAKNSLTQMSFGPKCSGRIAMDASGMKDGDIAGLAAFQDNLGFVAVKKAGTALSVVMFKGASQEASVPINQNKIFLRIDMDFTNRTDKATFFYSLDSTKWNPIGSTLQMSYTLTMFMGYRFTLFNYATKTTGGYADFDWYQIGSSVNQKIDIYPVTAVVNKQISTAKSSINFSYVLQKATSALNIRYQVTNAGHLTISLYNTRGVLVDCILDRSLGAGNYSVDHQITGLAIGHYLLRCTFNGKAVGTNQVLIMR